jgi:predicted permease
MRTLGRIGRQLSSRLWKASIDEEVEAELAFHVEMRTRDLIARGVPADEARRAAVRRFGDLQAVGAECKSIGQQREREMHRTEYVDELLHDTRFAIRHLARTPAFTIIAALTLALGLGATTAIFSAVNAVVLRPFGYAHPDRTMLVLQSWRGEASNVSAADFVEWEAQATRFDHMAAVDYASVNLAEGETPERVLGAKVTAGFFPVFGVEPALGRVFGAVEDRPGSDGVVVLSHALWQRKFNADRGIIGRAIRLNGQPHTVIGVMPAGFDPAAAREQLWIPAAFTPERKTIRDEQYLVVYGLLKPGVSMAQAQAEMEAIRQHQREINPTKYEGKGVRVSSLPEAVMGDVRQGLLVLLGAVGCVLLISCGNVANLLLAKGASRAKEFGIRSAIGAGRSRIVRQLLTESLVLALLAAALGVALAVALVRVLVAAAPDGIIPRLEQTRIDGTVLLFALAAAVVSSMIFGLLPALRVAKSNLQGVLREGGRSMVASAHDRVRNVLIATEVAMALSLLVGAGLLIRSAVNLQRVPLGFDGRGVLTARIALPSRNTRDGSSTAESSPDAELTFRLLVERLQQSPRVREVALASNVPLESGGSSNGLVPEGKAMDAANVVQSTLRLVTPNYFTTLRIPLLLGRTFSKDDRQGAPLAVVISKSLADRAWPGENPIGKRLTWGSGPDGSTLWQTVIGVVGDVRSGGPAEAIAPEYYLSVAQASPIVWDWVNRAMTVVLRPRGADLEPLATDVREAVHALDPTLPVFQMATMDERLDRRLAQSRFNTMLLTVLGVVGLLLAAAGIYSVIAYFVTLRTQEIGVRMALGATTRSIVGLLTWQGLQPVLVGVVLGGAIAFWTSRLLQGSLVGVGAADPLTFFAVAAGLIVIALAAIVIPARRAASVQPTQALNM